MYQLIFERFLNTSADGVIRAVDAKVFPLPGTDTLWATLLVEVSFYIENPGGRGDNLKFISPDIASTVFTRVEGDSEETVQIETLLGKTTMIILGFGTDKEKLGSEWVTIPTNGKSTVYTSIAVCEKIEIEDTQQPASDSIYSKNLRPYRPLPLFKNTLHS